MNRSNMFYAICTIIVIFIFGINLLLLTNLKPTSLVNLNSWIDTGNTMTHYDYDKLLGYIDTDYMIYDNSNNNRNYEFEDKMISFAKEFTQKLFDNTYSSNDLMNKYYIRNSFNLFGISSQFNTDDSNNKYLNNYRSILNLKNSLDKTNSSYNKIKNIKLYYAYSHYYVIQLYLDTSSNDKILELKIIYENSSDSFKVSDILYIDNSYINDFKNNYSKIKRFSVLDHKDGENTIITDEAANELKNKYIDSIVKIDVYDNNKKHMDTVTGFFIDSDIIVTTFDIFNNGIFRQYDYDIHSMSGTKLTFKGIVTFSRNYNLAIIKIGEDYGTKIEMDYLNDGFRGDDIMVSSIDGSIYIGQTVDISYANGYIVRSSLPLQKQDRGNIILNNEGKIIGINTYVDNTSSVLLSTQLVSILNPYNNITEHIKDVNVFKINMLGSR